MSRYLEILEKFQGLKTLVVGDAILDVYHFGRVDRISPEAPIPIFLEDLKKIETRRGGADNVAHQLEALGCNVVTHISTFPSVKHRYMVGNHQMFRTDYDAPDGQTPGKCKESVQDQNVVIFSDYDKGFLAPPLCTDVISRANDHKIPVVIDPKGANWHKFHGADYICPNEKEWKAHRTSEFAYSGPKAKIILKRGEHGIRVYKDDYKAFDPPETPWDYTDIPAKSRPVYDVTGAGDTVVAVFAACIGTGADPLDAAYIANIAAGWTVGELGTRVCPLDKLKAIL